ncbi:hypothetical protein K435DRAFT_773060 [Dendrothele bispora CBS 962.96]|uniref:RhoGAP-domain-containing protein n=1 Tax=Dendrothele bispora (strain CBS 962.96) TaxID=1314807 RepID=A0A4S8MW79_DENBC|nr:hypothetical protein K435DRAFT_773060 [Dendrothele bispora CBS 962.96]
MAQSAPGPRQSPSNPVSSANSTPSKSNSRNPRQSRSSTPGHDAEEHAWGSNFWVTLVDPQSQTSFFACPATGQVSWDPPVGNFVLPPSADGEWWELSDDSRGGLPYYYQTKTGETVWERPSGFVIPLGIIQNTALGRRLSNRFSQSVPEGLPSMSSTNGPDSDSVRRSHSTHSSKYSNPSPPNKKSLRRSYSNTLSQHLPPIPASPPVTDASVPPSPSPSQHSLPSQVNGRNRPRTATPKLPNGNGRNTPDSAQSSTRARSKSSSYVSHKPKPPQSLNAALELLAASRSESSHLNRPSLPGSPVSSNDEDKSMLSIPQNSSSSSTHGSPSPSRSVPNLPRDRSQSTSVPKVGGKEISAPILNHVATLEMSPVKSRAAGKPIPVEPQLPLHRTTTSTYNPTYPALPQDLASDILQFSESDYAKQYFSTHRTGFIFRRRVPVDQMMAWQKTPLNSPLLALNRSLNRDAVKVFKVIQHIMGDRDRDRAVHGVKLTETQASTVASINASSSSPTINHSFGGILEEERWLLGEGLVHGELRDEIYCQVMKQLTRNPHPESVFKGWQLLCVLLITFPPSKNFETYLRSFIQQHISKQEGRVDVMAKYCLKRLGFISRKGPRGKPPTIQEIETASDAAFNPSTFGESLDAIIRLQERNYPQQKVPIILPFLADGILALGGTKAEGIFRVPGDADSVSELKLRIDRGYYNLDGVDDPHILASLMKLWLRELCDPLIPEEMYNECVASAKDPEACVHIVQRLPTINRRVVLFIISFLQMFLEDKVQSITKMTPANVALVMAPNLLRCNSDKMSVVFTNAQYEQIFVYNLLLHLRCGEADPNYKPAHGLGAVQPSPAPRMSKSKSRRPQH